MYLLKIVVSRQNAIIKKRVTYNLELHVLHKMREAHGLSSLVHLCTQPKKR